MIRPSKQIREAKSVVRVPSEHNLRSAFEDATTKCLDEIWREMGGFDGEEKSEVTSLFNTPSHIIPEGGEEFLSDGMRALRFADTGREIHEVRVVGSDKWDRRWPRWYDAEWDSLLDEDIGNDTFNSSPAHKWLKHQMALYPYADRPAAKDPDPGKTTTHWSRSCDEPSVACGASKNHSAGNAWSFFLDRVTCLDCLALAEKFQVAQDSEPGESWSVVQDAPEYSVRKDGPTSAIVKHKNGAFCHAWLEDGVLKTEATWWKSEAVTVALQKLLLETEPGDALESAGPAADRARSVSSHLGEALDHLGAMNIEDPDLTDVYDHVAGGAIPAVLAAVDAWSTERNALRRERDGAMVDAEKLLENELHWRKRTAEALECPFCDGTGDCSYCDDGEVPSGESQPECMDTLRTRAETAESQLAEVTRRFEGMHRELSAYVAEPIHTTQISPGLFEKPCSVGCVLTETLGETLDRFPLPTEAPALIPRKEVMWFARWMEVKLRENDHKDGWKQCSVRSLYKHAGEEMDELVATFELDFTPENTVKLIREAADVANMVMMVADNASRNELPEPTEPKEEPFSRLVEDINREVSKPVLPEAKLNGDEPTEPKGAES